MIHPNRRTFLAAAVAATAPWTGARAQESSSKPLRIIVPFPAGGPVDGLARAVGRLLLEATGQTVIVDNKPEANGIIATDFVAKSAPDGTTLLLATDANISINPLVYSKLPFDARVDLKPVTVLTHVPEHLFVRADLAANNLQEFIALAKAQPGKLNYGSYGNGSSAHLEFEALKVATGIDVVHIPYKGAAEVYPAMLAGRIDAAISSPVAPLPHVRAGKLKALAVMGRERTALFPDVQTFSESGVPGFEVNPWFGLLVPGKTPPETVDRLDRDISKIVAQPSFRQRYIDPIGLLPAPLGRAYFVKLLETDREKYARYVKAAKIQPE